MNENLKDDNPEINLDGFAVTSQYYYFTFNDLYFLSRDNYDAEDFIIPTDFTTKTNSGDIEVKVQEKSNMDSSFQVVTF